jgi:hypothetical protein
MSTGTVLTFCAGFFAGVLVLTIADAIDHEAPPGRAAFTFRQGAWALAVTASVIALVVALR